MLRGDEAVTGWAGLAWQGARWFEGTYDGVVERDVQVVAQRHLLAQPGWRVSQELLPPWEVEVVDGVPVTTAVRSVVFEMRYAASLGDAVVALDMACYDDLVSLEEVRAYVETLGPVTGVQRARDALALGDENSWSPQETRMRGLWTMRAGLPPPLCNPPVFTLDGRHLGTPDLLAPGIGLLGQYHGGDHLTLTGAAADYRKEDAYREVGLEPVVMLAADWKQPEAFAARLRAAAARAATRGGPPGWTLETPAGWTRTDTVARRRALDPRARDQLLRYRRTAA